MRDWTLNLEDPLYLTFAADARLSDPDYINDHIWEIELGKADPPAISVNTTYGLRARSMRLFLRFTENNETVSNPKAFPIQPVLRRFYPNYLAFDFLPFENLHATTEFWVPESHALAGRVLFTNRSNSVRQLKFEVCAVLAPLEGKSIVPTQQQMVNVLAGQTSGLAPVVFMTGGSKHGPGPHPSLMLELELGPGAARQLAFAQAALDTIPASFELARHTAARPWEAERTRIEMLDVSQTLEITTGDKDWDAALAFSQRAEHSLIFNQSNHLPHATFVHARHSDHGFSRKGDGTDYPPAWNGQSPLEAYYLSSLLHGAPHLTRGLILNFLATQDGSGEVDHRPGLAGQRGKMLAAPLLSSLTWNYFQLTQDQAFLGEVFPKLLKFFWSWFSAEHDRNRDGIPEWDHLMQTGFEDNPLFDVWHPWSQGLDISWVHSPALEAMLYREARALENISKQLGKPAEETALVQARAEVLKTSIEAGWNARTSLYAYRDRETGLTAPGKVIGKKKGDGNMRPKYEAETPARLLIEIQTRTPAAKRPEVEIGEYFIMSKGEVETIPGHQFQWRSGGLVATTQKTFTRVGRVSVHGLGESDRLQISLVDTSGEDITLALPVWAGIPERQKVQALIARNLAEADRFDRPFGMPSLPSSPDPEADLVSMSMHFPWIQLIGEGLLAYGFRAEAVRLTSKMMKAVIRNLKQNHTFHQRYHAGKGTGIGERNSLHGFAPVGLFLQTLGVTIHSAARVRLEGKNLFPWPVTIKYRGLTILRGQEQTVVTFANGETAIVKDEAPCLVEN